MSGFNPLGGLMSFMDSIPSAQNNNPMGMLGGIMGMLGNAGTASSDPAHQAQGAQINQIMPFISSANGLMNQMGGAAHDAQNGPPIQGQGWGPAGIPGFRGNNYGISGTGNSSIPVQDIMSMLSGLMGGGAQNSGGIGGTIRGALGGLFGGQRPGMQSGYGYGNAPRIAGPNGAIIPTMQNQNYGQYGVMPPGQGSYAQYAQAVNNAVPPSVMRQRQQMSAQENQYRAQQNPTAQGGWGQGPYGAGTYGSYSDGIDNSNPLTDI